MKCIIGDCDVYYEVMGDGTPVINLHGSTLDIHSMTGCMEPIFENRKGWKQIYPDLRGHGKTPGKEWIIGSDDVLQVVLDFTDSIIPDTQFVLVGLSYGGYAAASKNLPKVGHFIDVYLRRSIGLYILWFTNRTMRSS